MSHDQYAMAAAEVADRTADARARLRAAIAEARRLSGDRVTEDEPTDTRLRLVVNTHPAARRN